MSSAGETISDAAGRVSDAAEPAVSVAKEVMTGVKEDHVTLMGAGVAFFGFLAFIPALVAVVSIYGLVGDPDNIQARVDDMASAMPEEARGLVVQQLESITNTSGSALSIGLAISVIAALWATSSGMAHLVEAVNMVHGNTDERNMVHKRLLGIGLTVGAIVFAIAAIFAITIWPNIVDALNLPSPADWLLKLTVWPVLALGLMVALAVLYHVAPDRAAPAIRWISWGSGIAVALWIATSILFQIYASNFGSYNETYGSLGAIVIGLLWLWISASG
jgi:membrane protein